MGADDVTETEGPSLARYKGGIMLACAPKQTCDGTGLSPAVPPASHPEYTQPWLVGGSRRRYLEIHEGQVPCAFPMGWRNGQQMDGKIKTPLIFNPFLKFNIYLLFLCVCANMS